MTQPIILLQTVDGQWHVGRQESIDEAADAVEIAQPHTLHLQPTPDGRGVGTALHPYGFPVIRSAQTTRKFYGVHLLQAPAEAPKPLADAWLEKTSGLAVASQVPQGLKLVTP
jgi:hypothetical protein